MTIDIGKFTIDCTGDACTGDIILFTEAVFGGSYRNPRFLGERRIAAQVVRDSYGTDRQQHTFTLKVIASDGYDALEADRTVRRKGRNVYRNGTRRWPWSDERERKTALDDKHRRGDVARALRDERKNAYDFG